MNLYVSKYKRFEHTLLRFWTRESVSKRQNDHKMGSWMKLDLVIVKKN